MDRKKRILLGFISGIVMATLVLKKFTEFYGFHLYEWLEDIKALDMRAIAFLLIMFILPITVGMKMGADMGRKIWKVIVMPFVAAVAVVLMFVLIVIAMDIFRLAAQGETIVAIALIIALLAPCARVIVLIFEG